MTFEMFHVARDGRQIPVEISSHLFEMNGQRLTLSVARDLTERKKKRGADPLPELPRPPDRPLQPGLLRGGA